ncbi:hypothetical protein [Erythrobacter aureus]|uniref:Uncharacterized protein n=1 Tax=Erythrobacter aureus TaxID=2182384 RepID=A0A345YJ25_9SPHN|nr:hypothetical protein [Erythrobacter aureus]AXK43927.1 hypothetical protein DVR09_15850 [Erythrobacter aureus]
MRIQHLLFAPALALAAATPAIADDERREQAYIMGQSWANGGISARCLIEVTDPAEHHLLKTEIGREAAAYRAQVLAGLYRIQAHLADKLHPLIEKQKEEQRDLLINGLIIQAEYDDTVGTSERNYEASVAEAASRMAEAPACDFYRLHQNSPTVQRAKALLATR